MDCPLCVPTSDVGMCSPSDHESGCRLAPFWVLITGFLIFIAAPSIGKIARAPRSLSRASVPRRSDPWQHGAGGRSSALVGCLWRGVVVVRYTVTLLVRGPAFFVNVGERPPFH